MHSIATSICAEFSERNFLCGRRDQLKLIAVTDRNGTRLKSSERKSPERNKKMEESNEESGDKRVRSYR